MGAYRILVPELWYTEYHVADATDFNHALQQVNDSQIEIDSKYLAYTYGPVEEPYLVMFPDGKRMIWNGHMLIPHRWLRAAEYKPKPGEEIEKP